MKNSLLNLSDPFFTTRFLGFDNLFDSLRTFGHNIKGSGGMYGFNEITEIGAVIEAAAKEENMALIKSNLNDLDLFLKSKV